MQNKNHTSGCHTLYTTHDGKDESGYTVGRSEVHFTLKLRHEQGHRAPVDATLKRQLLVLASLLSDWDLMVATCHYSGSLRWVVAGSQERLFRMADGFGQLDDDGVRKVWGDWSHFRDSSDDAVAAIAKDVRNQLQWHRGKLELDAKALLQEQDEACKAAKAE